MPRSSDLSDATSKIRKKYASLFISAVSVHGLDTPIIDVATLADLVDVAKKYETVIAELNTHDKVEYLLLHHNTGFRFTEAVLAPTDTATSAPGGPAATTGEPSESTCVMSESADVDEPASAQDDVTHEPGTSPDSASERPRRRPRTTDASVAESTSNPDTVPPARGWGPYQPQSSYRDWLRERTGVDDERGSE